MALDRSILDEMRVHAGIVPPAAPRRAHRDGPSDHLYERVMGDSLSYKVRSSGWTVTRALRGALFGLYTAVREVQSILDSLAYADADYSPRAVALRDGPVAQLTELVNRLGYAVDSSFTTGYSYSRRDDSLGSLIVDETLPGALLTATGEVGRVTAILGAVKDRLAAMNGDGVDPDAVAKSSAKFVSSAPQLLERIGKGLEDLAADIARAEVR